VSDAVVITDRRAIALVALKSCERACRFYAEHGVKLARNLPTVADLRRRYGITARTYAQAADELSELHAARYADYLLQLAAERQQARAAHQAATS
jgi:hypothetical protein